ncbi:MULTISPECIES: PaaI family thioesterase [Roseobacteraceae]|uniref:Thioesterase superfamily protein n=1 Tax=Pseudosulfitobacter pseudonitzschiae TaxID=1402135 RepID=A0A221JXB3_9RHOB|nr:MULTISPECIES: PaaI family thioesterase [Roseobacteraceae]ASM71391.1 thioesterase superfamily protein [Pseudosulfitobacter pseudonitzschiae]
MIATTVTHKTRSYDYPMPAFDPVAAMQMSGLEYLQALTSGRIGAEPSIGPTVGMHIPHELGEGRAVVDATPSDFVLNPMGGVHGGFAATVLDSALGLAIHTILQAGEGFSTAELKVNYTRAMGPTAGRMRATGTLIHRGRQMATAEARLVGVEDGKLYAHATTTCFIFSLHKG